MKIVPYMVLLAFIALLLGCDHLRPSVRDANAPNPDKTLKPVDDGMKDVSKSLDSSSERVKSSAEDVRKGADGAREGAESGDMVKVRQETQNLRLTADELDQEALRLQEYRSKVDILRQDLGKASVQSVELRKLYDQAQKEVKTSFDTHEKEKKAYEEQIEALSSERDAALQKMLLFMIIGSIGLTGISVALCINGNPRMITWATAGLVTLGIAMAMRNHGKIFSTGIIITIAIIIGLIIYQLFTSKQSEKALEETVHSVEAMKQSLEEDDRQRIFGSGAHTGMLHTIQSESTQELVQKKRLRLKPKFKHTME